MKAFTKIMIAVLALTGAHVSAADAQHPGQLQHTVKYAGLDLSDPQEVEVLHRRLVSASEQVCSPLESRSLRMQAAHGRCVAKALSDGVASIDRPLLTRHHQEKTGESAPRIAAR